MIDMAALEMMEAAVELPTMEAAAIPAAAA
jgi:hypothetical protein